MNDASGSGVNERKKRVVPYSDENQINQSLVDLEGPGQQF